jgi:hypothetical protein
MIINLAIKIMEKFAILQVLRHGVYLITLKIKFAILKTEYLVLIINKVGIQHSINKQLLQIMIFSKIQLLHKLPIVIQMMALTVIKIMVHIVI